MRRRSWIPFPWEEHAKPAGHYGVSKFAPEMTALRLGRPARNSHRALALDRAGSAPFVYNAYWRSPYLHPRVQLERHRSFCRVSPRYKQLRDYSISLTWYVESPGSLDDSLRRPSSHVGSGPPYNFLEYSRVLTQRMRAHGSLPKLPWHIA